MFDIDIEKIVIFGIVALAVIPPKDLPRVLRTVGQTVGKMRRMAGDFQRQFMDALNEADLQSIKKDIESISEAAKIDTSFDPVADVKRETEAALHAPVTTPEPPPVTVEAPAPEPAAGAILPPKADAAE